MRFCLRLICLWEVQREPVGLCRREDAAVEDGLEGEFRFGEGAAEAVDAFGGVGADVGVGGEGVQGHGVEVEGTKGFRGDVEPVGQSPDAGGVHAADVQELGDVGVEAQALAVGQDLAGVVGADAGEGVQGGAVGGVEFDTVPAPAVVGV